MFKKNLALLLIISLFTMICLSGCSSEKTTTDMPEKKVIKVTDLAGRDVEINGQASRVVLANGRFIQEFSAICGENFADKLVGIGSDLLKFDEDIYNKYAETFPQIKDIADIGHFSQGNLNIEKIISLKPDVVFIQLWFLEAAADTINALENAGIPVVIIDFSINPIKAPPQSISLMGKILGEEKKAEDISNYFNEQVEIVFSNLEKIEKQRPTVYIENGGRGPSEYGRTYGKGAWGKIVDLAGGKNIAEDIIKGMMGDISPEYLIDNNPENIIIAGYSSERAKQALRFGYYVQPDEARNLLKGHLNRPGWDSLNAVNNKKVYGVAMGHCIQMYNFFPLQAFAKWFYPEEFKDLNPEENLKGFHEKFSVVDYSGTWSIGIK